MAHPEEWLLATRNAGKLAELRAMVEGQGIRVVDLEQAGIPESAGEDGIECFETFEENALAKARWFAERAGGRVVVADDSGLAVRALGGQPGVRSRRWSGSTELSGEALDDANNAKLVQALRGARDRSARFVCAVAWRRGGTEVVVRGEVEGTIVDTASGTHGFGYDPHFFVGELGMTLADATRAQKSVVSHRGRAFAVLVARLREAGLLGG